MVSAGNKKIGLASGAGIYIVASMLNAAIPFLLLPVLTRYLTPAEYGEVAMFQVWVALVGALCGLSVHGAATRKYYDYDNPDQEMGYFVFSCLVILFVSSAVFFVLLVPFSDWVAKTIGLSKTWLQIGVLFALSQFLVQIRLGQWQARKQPVQYGVFQVSMSFVNVMLSLVLVVVFSLGVSGRLAGYTGAISLFGLGAIVLLRWEGLLKVSWRPELIKEALRFGVPLVPHIFGAFLLLTIDRAVVSAQVGLDAAGYYMVAVQLSMVMGLVLESVNRAYVPWLYERLKRDRLNEKMLAVKLTYCYGGILILIAAVSFIIGGPLLVFIAGSDYEPAAPLIGWLILGKSFHGLYYTVSGYIFYAKRTGVIAKITIFVGILNVILLLVFINQFGLIGAAWAMCLSMFVQWLLTWRAASRLVQMPWSLRSSQ